MIDQNELLQALRNGALVDALSGLPIPGGMCMPLAGGVVMFGRNEFATYALEDDPSAFRGGSITGGLCKFSGNMLKEHPEGTILWARPGKPTVRFHEVEVVLLQFKQDERVRDLPADDSRRYQGEVTLHLMNPALVGTIEDPVTGKVHDGMQKIAQIRTDGVEFYVPLTAPNLAAPSRFRSDDGRYVYNVQGDPTPEFPYGRIVQYDRNGSDDPTKWTAVAILRPEKA